MSKKYGRLAQLGERLPYKQNVSSSILLSPTINKKHCENPLAMFFIYGFKETLMNLSSALPWHFSIFKRIFCAA